MRAHAGLKRYSTAERQRAAFLAAKQDVERIFKCGLTPEQVAQAHAEIEASRHPQQPQLPLKVRP